MAVAWRQDSGVYRRYIKELVNVYQQRSDIRAFTEILLSVLAIFIFGVFAIRPTLVTIASLNGEINSKKETLDIMNTKIDNIVTAQQLFESRRGLISLLQTSIPQEATPLEFGDQIEKIAKKNGVDISNLSLEGAPLLNVKEPTTDIVPEVTTTPTDPGAPTTVSEKFIPLTISVEGEFPNIASFMTDLEKMRRPLYPLSLLVTLQNLKELNDTRVIFTVAGKIPYLP